MALQLIDLNEDVEYIDIDVSKVPYSFSIKLTDKTYTFTVKYNEVGKFFTVDLLDLNGDVLVFGEIIRYGRRAVPAAGHHPRLHHRRRDFRGDA